MRSRLRLSTAAAAAVPAGCSLCGCAVVPPCLLLARRCNSSSSSSSSSSDKAAWVAAAAEIKAEALGKKLAPPPPTFGFAAPKPGQQMAPGSRKTFPFRAAAAAAAPPTREDGEVVSDLVFSRRYRFVHLSVKDVLMDEFVVKQGGHSSPGVEVLSVVDALSDMLEEEELRMREKHMAIVQQLQRSDAAEERARALPRRPEAAASSSSSSTGVTPAAGAPFSPSSSSSSGASSSTAATAPHTVSALRVPEDIIATLCRLTEKTGSVAFADVPSAVVRALVGHDGYTATPTLDDDAHPGIVNAVARVITPVGVFAVDLKRKQIRVRPGVAQLAARVEQCVHEVWAMNSSNYALASSPADSGKLVNKRVALSSVYAFLTGTERSFAADVGGLARVVAVFPSQFVLTKDSTYVTRPNVPVGNMAIDAAARHKQKLEREVAEAKAKAQQPQQQQQQQSSPETAAATATTSSSTSGSSLFARGVESLHVVQAGRRARETSGASLLANESIFGGGADDEDDPALRR